MLRLTSISSQAENLVRNLYDSLCKLQCGLNTSNVKLCIPASPERSRATMESAFNNWRILAFFGSGRGERIRTSDPRLPKPVLYQAELHPEPLRPRYTMAPHAARQGDIPACPAAPARLVPSPSRHEASRADARHARRLTPPPSPPSRGGVKRMRVQPPHAEPPHPEPVEGRSMRRHALMRTTRGGSPIPSRKGRGEGGARSLVRRARHEPWIVCVLRDAEQIPLPRWEEVGGG
jgi:hypothetical protein